MQQALYQDIETGDERSSVKECRINLDTPAPH